MGDAFIVRKSGSKKGGGLLLKVIAAASASALPESAAENTLAVITGTDITSWAFSSVRQEAYNVEGFVWFYTKEAEEYTSVNILPENEVRLNINACMQYHNGEWTVKPSWIYTGGAWSLNATVLYCKGDKETPLTDELRLHKSAGGSYTDNPDNIFLSYTGSSNRDASVTVKKLYNLSDYSSICVDADITASSSDTRFGLFVGVIDDYDTKKDYGKFSDAYQSRTIGRMVHRYVIPDAYKRHYYIMIANAVTRVNIYKIWLE